MGGVRKCRVDGKNIADSPSASRDSSGLIPKNSGRDQRVPVIGRAILERLRYRLLYTSRIRLANRYAPSLRQAELPNPVSVFSSGFHRAKQELGW